MANLYDQAEANENDNFKARYYPGVGTGGSNGNLIHAGVLPTRAIHHAAEKALAEFAEQARDFLRDTPGSTYADLSVSTVGFSRGTASEVMFTKLLHERGLVLPDGTVVAPPGSVPVTSMVLLDPVHTFIQEDLSLPPNVVGKVLVLGARDELRGEFKLADYRNDARVLFTEMAANHTAYFQNSSVGLGDVLSKLRFDATRPIAKYTELYQVARNGDVVIDEQSRPVKEWRELRSRGATLVGSGAQEATHGRPDPAAPTAAAPGPEDPRNPLNRDHGLYSLLQQRLPDASEDRLVQFTAACHMKGITDENLGDIYPLETTGAIRFHPSWPPGPAAHVDLRAPMPSPQQAMQQVQEFDQQQQVIQQAQAQQMQVSQQQGPMPGFPMR